MCMDFLLLFFTHTSLYYKPWMWKTKPCYISKMWVAWSKIIFFAYIIKIKHGKFTYQFIEFACYDLFNTIPVYVQCTHIQIPDTYIYMYISLLFKVLIAWNKNIYIHCIVYNVNFFTYVSGYIWGNTKKLVF